MTFSGQNSGRTVLINPLTAQLLPSATRSGNRTPGAASAHATAAKEHPAQANRPAHAGLAASIKADGGLDFLRSRLEEKMGKLFEKAAAKNPELAAAGPEAFFNTSVDVTPEATADRIVGFALGLRGIFSRQNKDLSQDEMMTRFETEIRRGINEGFGHARGVLGDLELLSDEVENNVDLTWDLVQQKLSDFFDPAPAENQESAPEA
jgi:hypothetical protein